VKPNTTRIPNRVFDHERYLPIVEETKIDVLEDIIV